MSRNGYDFDPTATGSDMFQESAYDAASSRYSDLFDGKFNSFDPEKIVSSGNNALKTGQFDIDVEDSDLALGYKQPEPATSPKPGRFFD